MISRRPFVGFAIAAALAGLIGPSAAAEEAMLLEAAASGDAGAVARAMAAGADLEARDGDGRTALLLATRGDHEKAARLLIEAGADVNARDGIEDTPFLYAGAEGRNAILRAILESGRARLDDTNRYGGTALIPAAHHGHPETVRILLATQIDIDHVNRLGWTALLEAVILGDGGPVYQEIVRLLVAAGAKPIADRDGVTPLAHAERRGFAEIAHMLRGG